MSEMIERVALAISGSDDPANILKIHRIRARLAIQAMREPTDAMLGRGEEIMGDYDDFIGPGPCSLLSPSYQAMIDEALK